MYRAELNDYVRLRIRNSRYLMRRGYVIEVRNAKIDLSESSEKKLAKFLDDGIADLGGIWFIEMLF